MQAEQLKDQVADAPGQPAREADADRLTVTEHRIYVWSSPAPYAVVIQELRSFLRHI